MHSPKYSQILQPVASPHRHFMRRFATAFTGLSATSTVIAGLLALALPLEPAWALQRNNYQQCASKLIDTGLNPETVASVCARARHPDELGNCVVKINNKTDITAQDALSTCTRVRRPEELATCVVDISNKAEAALAPVVLDNCRRSLLPKRYSECVVGLTRRIELLPKQAMVACIDAADRLGPFDPSFIPQNQQPPFPTPR